jgi:uncharacterized protein (UPF0335 family)
MAREILTPRWGNEQKTHIIAKFRYDDGRIVDASISVPEGGSNSDWDEIIETFGTEYLDEQTTTQLNRHIQRKAEAAEQRKLNIERSQKEILFNAKAEAFDMDIVKNSTNREIKNKIRRANSIMEVQVYTAMLHMIEDPIVNPTANT